jgi:hypothetical protein
MLALGWLRETDPDAFDPDLIQIAGEVGSIAVPLDFNDTVHDRWSLSGGEEIITAEFPGRRLSVQE